VIADRYVQRQMMEGCGIVIGQGLQVRCRDE
jgi:hypothetical protein